jgi:SAM-dependent methyltransferase
MTTLLMSLSQEIDLIIRSDKDESYLIFYEELFHHIRHSPLNILEVGVFHGGSLLMFSRYFPEARLLGVDLNLPPSQFYEEYDKYQLANRVKVLQGSQSDKRFLDNAIYDTFAGQQLDIVIDDASHIYKHTKITFNHVFINRLKSGGTYIIEDWGCGYWPKWPDGNPNGRSGLPRLVKELVDLVALRDRTKLFQGKRAIKANSEQNSPISRMIILPSIMALVKR